MQMYLLEELEAHPQNPRQQNQEVVESLTAQMVADGFGEQHAILIRPLDGRFQIVSGHHRVAAAWKAELTEVPAICKEMDDEEAYMQLLLCNTQTGLTALERGLHALNCVALGEAFKEGGLREYARRVGCSKSEISRLRHAAEVSLLSPRGDKVDVSTRVLSELHKLPKEEWKPTLRKAIDQEWTVAKTIDKVKEMRGIVPEVKEPYTPEIEAVIERADVLEVEDDYTPTEEPEVQDTEEVPTHDKLDTVIESIKCLDRDTRYKIYLELQREFG
jgi:ParB/RepB/Spo0J family partition protein